MQHNKHVYILAFWLVFLVGLLLFAPLKSLADFKIGEFSDRHSESSLVAKKLIDQLGYGTSRFFVLFHSDQLRADAPQFTQAMHYALAGLKQFPKKHIILYPEDNIQQISQDRHTAYATVLIKGESEADANLYQRFKGLLHTPVGFSMLVGGESAFIAEAKSYALHDLYRADIVAILIACIILLYVFASFTFAAITLLLSGITVMVILALLALINQVTPLSVFALNVSTLLGLSLSLDYALIISMRLQAELKTHSLDQSLIIVKRTAMRTVLISGLVVLVGFFLLLFFAIDLLYSIGIAGVVVVCATLATSLLLLPALFKLSEPYLLRFRLPRIQAWQFKSNHKQDIILKKVMQYPWWFITVSILLLLTLAYPFTQVFLSRANPDILPVAAESRQVSDIFKQQFNATDLNPILVLVSAQSIFADTTIFHLCDLADTLRGDHHIQDIHGMVSLDDRISCDQYRYLYHLPFGALDKQLQAYLKMTTRFDATLMTIVPKLPYHDQHTINLVNKIRNSHLDNGLSLQVGGSTATLIDTVHSLYHTFFYVLLAVMLTTYLLLVYLFHSLIVPMKAIFMNTLSVLVCYGMLVFIFQQGHLTGLFNFTVLGYTELELPILLFCALFGISMDYEIFLLSYIYEAYQQTHDNVASIRIGMQRARQVILSSGITIILIACAFITADIVLIKAFALCIAIAVLVDIGLIRSLLVPALMKVLGHWNWYFPGKKHEYRL